VRRRASSSCLMSGLDDIPAWHRLRQGGSPLRRTEESRRSSRTRRELHGAYRRAENIVVRDDLLAHLNISAANDPQDREVSIGGVRAALRRDGVTSPEVSPDWG
jgi:hypothetical protein